jgi:uncharacterized protein YbjT (DUF2867 family)
MIVITGATGHTGKVAAEVLLAAGEKVRVIGRTADKLQPFVAKGAEAFVGSVLDADAMTRAFTGATAAYLMIPPDLKTKNLREYDAQVGESFASALEKSGLKNAVVLSSVGAQLAEGAGPVSGLHEFEERMKRVSGLNILFLRPAYYMENLLSTVAAYQAMGFFAGLLKDDVSIPMIATRDIGSRAAAALSARDFTGHQTMELLGQRDLTMKECATIFGAAIGKPGLGYMQAPAMMARPALLQSGMSGEMADQLIELSKAINDRIMLPLESRSAANTTPTSFEVFAAQVLVPAYKGKSASA